MTGSYRKLFYGDYATTAAEEKRYGTAKSGRGKDINGKGVESRRMQTRSAIKFTRDTSLL